MEKRQERGRRQQGEERVRRRGKVFPNAPLATLPTVLLTPLATFTKNYTSQHLEVVVYRATPQEGPDAGCTPEL